MPSGTIPCVCWYGLVATALTACSDDYGREEASTAIATYDQPAIGASSSSSIGSFAGVGGAAGTSGGGAGSAGQTDASGASQGGASASDATVGSSGAGGGAPAEVELDPALLERCTGNAPLRCAIPVPDGNHTVTVELGDPNSTSSSSVDSELLRRTVPVSSLGAGRYSRHTFTVNVRAERHDGYSAPGGILDLLIGGSQPRLHGLAVVPATTAPTIFVAGDSTVCDWDPTAPNISSADQRGWAQALSLYLLPGIAVANYADSGETAGAFYSKFWPGADALRASDYLFVQFGHNDQKSSDAIASYRPNLSRYIADARAKGATVVLFTPVGRKNATLTARLSGARRAGSATGC